MINQNMMKKALFLSTLLLFFAAFALQAQTLQKGQVFQDEEISFEVDAIWEGEHTVFLTAPGEMYMTLTYKDEKPGEYVLTRYGDTPVLPFRGVRFGGRVQHVQEPGAESLVFYNSAGKVVRTLTCEVPAPESF